MLQVLIKSVSINNTTDVLVKNKQIASFVVTKKVLC